VTVSVAITCYNYGRYLRGCVESALAQTVGDLEIVIVDDGSTDDTERVARSLLPHPQIHYCRIANGGQAVAKNAAISSASGDIVAFLDADDLWLPTKLARQLPLFDDARVGVTFSDHSVIDAEGRDVPIGRRTGHMTFRRGRVTPYLGFENFVPFSGSAVRRALLTRSGGFDETLGMGIDWELWLRLSLECDFAGTNEKLFAYRIGHSGQMSKNAAGRLAASEHIFSRFLAQHPQAFTAEELRAIDFYNSCMRGDGYRTLDLSKASALFARAWRLRPLAYQPYLGFARNARQWLKTRGAA